MKLNRYKLENWTEECECCYCGAPILEGDYLVYFEPSGFDDLSDLAFCSPKCARIHRAQESQEVQPITLAEVAEAL